QLAGVARFSANCVYIVIGHSVLCALSSAMEKWKLGWKAIGRAQQDASMAGSAEQSAGLLFCSLAAWPSASPAEDPVLLSGIVLPPARQAPGLVCETWALFASLQQNADNEAGEDDGAAGSVAAF
ncbi:hypothetical protein H4R99_003091, partial [Coemansia sp. RSA 1722]